MKPGSTCKKKLLFIFYLFNQVDMSELSDNKVFFSQDGAFCRIHENGLLYRPAFGRNFDLKWEDIQFIKTYPAKIVLHVNRGIQIAIGYDLNNFEEILKEICLRCALLPMEGDPAFHKFKTNYFRFYMYLFANFMLLLVAISPFFTEKLDEDVAVAAIVSIFILPLSIFLIKNIVLSVILYRDFLQLTGLFKTKTIKYKEIERVGFGLSFGRKTGYSTHISIYFKNKKKITMSNMDDYPFLLVLLQAKLNEYRKNDS